MTEVIRMDKDDITIVAYLRQDARIKLTELTRKTGIPVSTLFDRVHDVVGLGITRFSALLDFPALGFNTRATILMKAGKDKRDALKAHLLKASCVNSLMRVNNGYDFMAECVFRDMRELEELCERLERGYGVKQREVHYVIEELTRERFLADPALVEKESPSEKPLS